MKNALHDLNAIFIITSIIITKIKSKQLHIFIIMIGIFIVIMMVNIAVEASV